MSPHPGDRRPTGHRPSGSSALRHFAVARRGWGWRGWEPGGQHVQAFRRADAALRKRQAAERLAGRPREAYGWSTIALAIPLERW